jgi:glutathione synthase/RimK-type ligase-like ATP-grasp enzyme
MQHDRQMTRSRIRKATFSDIPALARLMREAHARSRYQDVASFSEQRAKALLMNAIQRDGGQSEGSTFVAVSDAHGIDAFVIGMLQSVYMLSDDLEATDLFWYAKEGAAATSAKRVLRAMHRWAASCPKVVMIRQANTDAIVSPELSGRLLTGQGMRLTGNIYEKELTK